MPDTMAAAAKAERGEPVPPPPNPQNAVAAAAAGGPQEKPDREDDKAHSELKELEGHLRTAEAETERYSDVLRRLSLSKEDAAEIVDTLMIRGDRYQEDFFLLNGRLAVTFQTRLVSDNDLLQEAMEVRRPQYIGGVSAETWRHYLAASIVRYGERVFNVNTLEDYDARIAWINALQEPVFNMLVKELQQFDKKIEELLKPSFLRYF